MQDSTDNTNKQTKKKKERQVIEEEMGMVNLKSRAVFAVQLERQTHSRMAVNRKDGSVHQPTLLWILAISKNGNVRFRKKKPGCVRVKDKRQLDIDMTNLSNKEDKTKIGAYCFICWHILIDWVFV